jgi:hypothetical protein
MPSPTIPAASTVATIANDPDGHNAINRETIAQQTAGGRSVAAAATNTALTVAPAAGERQFIQKLILQCTLAPAAAGTITILDASGGTVLFNFEASTGHVAGTVLTFEFPVPLRTATAAALHVTTPANTGTWRYFVCGFNMQTNTLT